MTSPTSGPPTACELCAPATAAVPCGSRCDQCRRKGDLAGTVVWDIVTAAVRDSTANDRVTFMLTGLSAVFLEGIARQAPGSGSLIEGRSLLLAINPLAAEHVQVLTPAISSRESAVHWRHSKEASVIVFAPSDAEREAIGAGLGPLARIDDQAIVDRTSAWLKALRETGDAQDYMKAMLGGLRNSRIFFGLEMWVDFILAIQDQGFASPAHLRVQNAAPALQIPKDGITKLPTFNAHANRKPGFQDFNAAFQTARSEVSVYAGLITRKQEPVDTQAVRDAIDEYDHQNEPDTLVALDIVKALLADELNIRPGEWRDSQRDFCERVSWERIGAHLFSGQRNTTRRSLGEQTLAFIEGDYRDEVTQEDRTLLETLKDSIPKEPKEEEIEFFARWQERLNHPYAIKIFKSWQKRLFSKEVVGHDLLAAFSEGFEALIIAGSETLSEMKDPKILVRTTQHNRATFWERLDTKILTLFRFELKSIRGILSDPVLWDLDACFEQHASFQTSASDARRVDLELYLVEAADVIDLAGLREPPRSAPRVKATWQPGLKPRDEPISLAFPDDIEGLESAVEHNAGLFRRYVFAPRQGGNDSRISPMTLTDTTSFSDIAQTQDGRTFDTTVLPEDDALCEFRIKVRELTASHSLESGAADELMAAVDAFLQKYRSAIRAIWNDPESGFAGELAMAQANSFGELCRTCRLRATSERARTILRPLVAGIGVIRSQGSDPMALVTAWHPLRLAERRAKIVDLADFVKGILASRTAVDTDLTIAFEERRALTGRWVFPEAAVVGETTMISVEDVAGYSLMVPADCVARSEEALENSTPAAAERFIEGVNQYLEVHPHETTNLSAAIYDSESLTLPQEIARLMAQRIHRDPDLRCDLVITHRNQERLRLIYHDQNMRLDAENISDTAKGFLSRLRVDVRPNRSAPGQDDAIRDMDLVLLHDAVSHYSRPIWDLERGSAEEFSQDFNLAAARKPRRRLTEVNASGVGIYLTISRPPRAVAEYHDLLYEIAKTAVLPPGRHGVLVRNVQFDDQQVQDLIKHAHGLAEWVISYDKVSSRMLLEKCGIKIIRDISVPGTKDRVIVSASKPDDRLKSNIREDLVHACGIDTEAANRLGDVILDDVIQISGKKMLSAARFANASREMIGLSLMRAYLEAALPEDIPVIARPIWISLDDYRGWFTSGKGKIADAVGMTILDSKDGFEMLVQVGEAKFITKASEQEETTDARKQVRDTVDRLTRIFVDNRDSISRAAWCARLADLLVNRDCIPDRIPDPVRQAEFLEHLGSGKVEFRIRGEAVICLHDDHLTAPRLDVDRDRPHLRHCVLPTPIIRQTLQAIADGSGLNRKELKEVHWHPHGAGEQSPAFAASRPQAGNNAPASEPARGMASAKAQATGAWPAPLPAGPEEIEDETLRTAESADRPMAVAPPAPWPAAKTETANARAADERPAPAPAGPEEMEEELRTTEPANRPAAVGPPAPTRSAANGEKPRFIPEPVYAVLKEMAGQEDGAVDDPHSVAWVERVCEDTQRALSHFGMQAHFVEPRYRLTPNGALISFRGHDTLTAYKIRRKTDELLTTYGIEVVDVRLGPGRISLFVKREKRARVPLASTWLNAPWPDREPGELTNFILGAREDDDKLLHLNLAGDFADYQEHGPHTIIAGETNSGKGVLIQNLLMQLIAFNAPEKIELVLIDPKKGVDFGWLDGTPHMNGPIITEMDEAEIEFDRLVKRMDDRYDQFKKFGAPNIAFFNKNMPPEKRMSRIFLVHDEMGAWMAQDREYQKMVLSSVSHLGMKARAAGIHLTLITQRADADAVPTRLRDNMGNRLCLKVQNSSGSSMVLGRSGAEKLLGKGHLACHLGFENPPPGQEYYVVQVPFAGTEDMHRLAMAAKAYWHGRPA